MGNTETATLAGGCFWCIEAAMKELDGVLEATSGYTGGDVADPTYRQVCTGETGHAEAVEVEYDPEKLSYEDILQVFFTVHDPTTLNRQGPDVGTQYRSAVYYHDDEQRDLVESFVEELEAEGAFDDPIVTEIEPLGEFYVAEENHQDYYEKNPGDAYCTFNAEPKIRKVREKFADKARQPPADD
ncbi:peptide-methionine (S)-S-oxide reductase MsrA [Haloprofundus sp. MHR1]|uniref:peptide-methionine (S)-S-oxide reductase MsrA n=1 Tax=Haloprofundus sp. MHR1 TaxID=2572921 RepID=UPI0010BE5B01|nr:peptide-methionine (S)-S-oxide reductase MsrA [Haloprofundus sp. MHR1]QCJ46705.1 peptide-methionine (S)-S-oxide reductase MsrA [Haloprofundus sp. MHR1]